MRSFDTIAMAPKKKSKKVAANPARGFATTSISSKVRVEIAEEETNLPQSPGIVGNQESHVTSSTSDIQTENQRDLATLSPEELEAQLEESELQMLVEKHGAKVKKDVARTVSRLMTERRLFRGQVETLPVSKWIPADMLQQLRDLMQESSIAGRSLLGQSELPEATELLIKLWALRLCLVDLGFSKMVTLETLTQIVQQKALLGKAQAEETRDGLWGLGTALDQLGAFHEDADLPAFDTTNCVKGNHSKNDVGESVDANNAQHSGDGTLIIPVSGAATPEMLLDTAMTRSNSQGSQFLCHTPEDSNCSLPSSETEDNRGDDDLNQHELLDRYILLKTRMFKILPDQNNGQSLLSRKRSAKDVAAPPVVNPQYSKLMKRVKAIESDILFDIDGAHDAWLKKRIELLQEAAERKKLGLVEKIQAVQGASQQELSTKGVSAEESTLDQLCDFFSSLPQESVDESGSSAITDTANGKPVVIRDFGKWVGVNPRRVLEETCRARDSSVKIVYGEVSETSFSVRYQVMVRWSRSQGQPSDDTVLPGLFCRSDEHCAQIRMENISTPDKHQAEAMVSVAALFHIFSGSPKEEKAYMKLPSTWRDLWSEFLILKNERLDSIDRDDLKEVREILDKHYQMDETENTKSKSSLNPMAAEFAMTETPVKSTLPKPDPTSFVAIWHAKSSSPYYQNMLSFRQQLPMWNFRDQLLDALESNQILIVCGETGCGKSTQTPAYILEHELSQGRDCRIYCTEPRRISAISLARRVSEELGERKHDVGTNRSLVGYAIRLESQISSTTRLVYATTGIVMRMLENPDGLDDITHIILDEVHERSIDSDFLLIIIRRMILKRPDLKIVLMSATVDAELFSKYLGGAPVLNVPGRTFPVEVKYLEDAVETVSQIANLNTINTSLGDDYDAEDQETVENSNPAVSTDLAEYGASTRKFLEHFNEYRLNFNLMVKLLEAVAYQPEYSSYSQAILVFLPGLAEIRKLNDMISGHPTFYRGWRIFPLHSTIATEAQEAAFEIPPPGIRKIVLATNIAETGITIPDITCVIDTGKHREMRFDERRQLSRLIECFVSKANAKQRRGRAGRVRNGLCFHLFTKARHDNILADQQTPEMLRLSLQDLSLRVKICKLGNIEEVLMQALDPPMPKNIRRAVDSLVDVKALTTGEELTSLGRQLAKLPLDVYLGKLILFSAIFQCLDAGLTIAAILTSKSPFSASFGDRDRADQARLSFQKGDSDLLTVYNAYTCWRKTCQTNPQSEQQFCRKNFLIPQTLANIEELKGQLASIMLEADFFKLEPGRGLLSKATAGPYPRKFVDLPASTTINNANELIVNTVVTWSFYPKLLCREGKGYRNISTNQTVSLHPASINKSKSAPPRYLSYYSIMQSSSKFYNALETSAAEDFAVALICGDAEFKVYSGIMTIDGNRLRFAMGNWKTMMVVKAMRAEMKEIIAQGLKVPSRVMSARQKLWMENWKAMFDRQNEIRRQSVR